MTRLLCLAAVLLTSACTRTLETKHLGSPPPLPPPAIREAFSRQVHNAVYAGEGDLEIQHLREQVTRDPRNMHARLQLARIYLRKGFPDIAAEHARLAAAANPDSEEACAELARILRSLRLLPEALATIADFRARHPASARIQAWHGLLLDDLGRHAEAEASHREAVRLAPQNETYRNNLGFNLLRQNKPQAAAEEFRIALKINPASQTAHHNHALALARMDLSAAVAEWRKITDEATAHSNAAAALIEQGQFDQAQRELEATLALQPNHAAALANLRLLETQLAASGRPPQGNLAQRFLRMVIGAEPPQRTAKAPAKAAKRRPPAKSAAARQEEFKLQFNQAGRPLAPAGGPTASGP